MPKRCVRSRHAQTNSKIRRILPTRHLGAKKRAMRHYPIALGVLVSLWRLDFSALGLTTEMVSPGNGTPYGDFEREEGDDLVQRASPQRVARGAWSFSGCGSPLDERETDGRQFLATWRARCNAKPSDRQPAGVIRRDRMGANATNVHLVRLRSPDAAAAPFAHRVGIVTGTTTYARHPVATCRPCARSAGDVPRGACVRGVARLGESASLSWT